MSDFVGKTVNELQQFLKQIVAISAGHLRIGLWIWAKLLKTLTLKWMRVVLLKTGKWRSSQNYVHYKEFCIFQSFLSNLSLDITVLPHIRSQPWLCIKIARLIWNISSCRLCNICSSWWNFFYTQYKWSLMWKSVSHMMIFDLSLFLQSHLAIILQQILLGIHMLPILWCPCNKICCSGWIIFKFGTMAINIRECFKYNDCWPFGVYQVLHCRSSWINITVISWSHNGCDSVSNHQPHHCLLNRLFRRRSKKTSNFLVTGIQ